MIRYEPLGFGGPWMPRCEAEPCRLDLDHVGPHEGHRAWGCTCVDVSTRSEVLFIPGKEGCLVHLPQPGHCGTCRYWGDLHGYDATGTCRRSVSNNDGNDDPSSLAIGTGSDPHDGCWMETSAAFGCVQWEQRDAG
jgi:hypothetical protein